MTTSPNKRKIAQGWRPVEEAVERYVVLDKHKNYRMFSWGFTLGGTYEPFYAVLSGRPVQVLNY